MPPALSLRHLLLGLLLMATQASAEIVEGYALEAMPYCGTEQGRPIGLAVEILQAASRHGAPEVSLPALTSHGEEPRSCSSARAMSSRPSSPFPALRPARINYRWVAELFLTQSRFYSYQRIETADLRNRRQNRSKWGLSADMP